MNAKKFFSKVYGVSHLNDDGSSRQNIIERFCVTKMDLLLIREPDNPYGANAIGIWVPTAEGDFQIGYVGTETSRDLAGYLDQGGIVKVTIKNLTGGKGKTRGVNIEVDVKGDGYQDDEDVEETENYGGDNQEEEQETDETVSPRLTLVPQSRSQSSPSSSPALVGIIGMALLVFGIILACGAIDSGITSIPVLFLIIGGLVMVIYGSLARKK